MEERCALTSEVLHWRQRRDTLQEQCQREILQNQLMISEQNFQWLRAVCAQLMEERCALTSEVLHWRQRRDTLQADPAGAGDLTWVAEKAQEAVDPVLKALQELPAHPRETAFRKLQRAFHPDKNLTNQEVASRVFQHLQQWRERVGI
eukprot:s1997_g4.t1